MRKYDGDVLEPVGHIYEILYPINIANVTVFIILYLFYTPVHVFKLE